MLEGGLYIRHKRQIEIYLRHAYVGALRQRAAAERRRRTRHFCGVLRQLTRSDGASFQGADVREGEVQGAPVKRELGPISSRCPCRLHNAISHSRQPSLNYYAVVLSAAAAALCCVMIWCRA